MNEKKSSKVKGIALGMALVLTMGAAATSLAMGVKNNGWFTPDNQVEDELPQTENDANAATNGINYMSLRMSDAAVVGASETGVKTVSKTLTATVMPKDAPDKSVDWSIEWTVPPTENADINEYLRVIPESDGALTATITAYKGFEGGSARVTATTRVGKYTAECYVNYEGAPEDFVFVQEGREVETVTLLAGTTNEISLDLRNTLGAVGSKYGDYEIEYVKGHGRFTLEQQYIVNGTVNSTTDVTFNLEQGYLDCTYPLGSTGEQTRHLTISSDEFFTTAITGDVLTVNVKKAVSSYHSTYPRTGLYFKYKGTYTDPSANGVPDELFWDIKIRDKVSGQWSLLTIKIESTVTDVSLSESVITF